MNNVYCADCKHFENIGEFETFTKCNRPGLGNDLVTGKPKIVWYKKLLKLVGT